MNKACLMIGTAVLLGHAAAHAQAPAIPATSETGTPPASGAAPAATADQNGPVELDTIIVTAQRRSQNLQDVPIAVVVATAADLQAAGVSDVQSLKVAVPGLEVQSNNGFALPVIRGIGSKLTGAGTETPVAFYIDGVYYASALTTLLNFNNIAQVEVLKGPQGTLFGRNATAGLVQVTTKDPTENLSGQLNVSYGNYQTLRGDAYVAGGIAQDLKADIALTGTTMGKGYGTNFFNGEDVYKTHYDIGARSKWLWDLDDTTVVRVIGDYLANKHSMAATRLPVGELPPPLYGAPFGGSPWDTNLNVQPIIENKGGGGSVRIDKELGTVRLASISAYRRNRYDITFDADHTSVAARRFDLTVQDGQFSQELQLLSAPNTRFNWVAGLYYFDAYGHNTRLISTFDGPSLGAAPTAARVTFTNSRQETDSIAGFGQATVQLFDGFNLTGGLRYTSEKRTLKLEQSTLRRDGVTVNNIPRNMLSTRYKKLTWRVGIDYNFTPDIMAYASYNRGFKSGGYNPTTVTLPPYRPEVLDAYEAGFKTTLFDRRVRFNAAAFYYDYQDVQVNIATLIGAGIFNGAAATVYGADAELNFQVSDRLRVNAGYQYAHGEYEDFPGAVIALRRPGGGYTITNGNVKGNDTLLTPKSTFSASANYTVPLGANSLDLNFNYYHNSGFFNDPDNSTRMPAYDLFNASARLELADGLSFTVWGKNLSNEAVTNVDGIQGLGAVGTRRANYAPPRTYGVTVGFGF